MKVMLYQYHLKNNNIKKLNQMKFIPIKLSNQMEHQIIIMY